MIKIKYTQKYYDLKWIRRQQQIISCRTTYFSIMTFQYFFVNKISVYFYGSRARGNMVGGYKKQLNSKLGLMHLWYLLQQKVYVFYKCMIFIHFRKMKVIQESYYLLSNTYFCCKNMAVQYNNIVFIGPEIRTKETKKYL